jgi:2-keto-4-pentenoate hydratase
VGELADELWDARVTGASVPAVELTLGEAKDILHELTLRSVSAGRTVVGWKIGRLPLVAGEDYFFAGPVFDDFDRRSTTLIRPMVEVEFVARFADRLPDGNWQLTWNIGLEIADNHDPDWRIDPAWCVADWAVHAAAAVGDPCPAPRLDQVLDVRLAFGDKQMATSGQWRTGHSRVLAILERDCPDVLRPCQPGDLIWAGSIIPPIAYTSEAAVTCSIEGFGTVTFR